MIQSTYVMASPVEKFYCHRRVRIRIRVRVVVMVRVWITVGVRMKQTGFVR